MKYENKSNSLHMVISFYEQVHFRYQMEKSVHADCSCKCDVYIGVTRLISTKFQQQITRNITEKFAHRLKEIFEVVEREILFRTQQDSSI